MAVHIRLRRIGKNPKGKPHFRVTVFDERMGRDSRVIVCVRRGGVIGGPSDGMAVCPALGGTARSCPPTARGRPVLCGPQGGALSGAQLLPPPGVAGDEVLHGARAERRGKLLLPPGPVLQHRRRGALLPVSLPPWVVQRTPGGVRRCGVWCCAVGTLPR